VAKRTCTIEGCDRPSSNGGLCTTHHRRNAKGTPLTRPIRQKRPSGMTPTEAFRFFMPGDPPGPSACWPWAGNTFDRGYGFIPYGAIYKNYPAHRASYELFIGPIPDGLHICHHCDNPPCVNPAHLYAGTNTDNIRDKVTRGRSGIGHTRPGGEKHHNAKLTNVEADEIRALYDSGGMSMRTLGARYGLSHFAIRKIVRGISYK